MFAMPMAAREISLAEATKTATNFFSANLSATKADMVDLHVVWEGSAPGTKGGGNAPALYVFNNEAGPGFVIVSGDDVAYPVLGYSFKYNFKAENMPINVLGWLTGIEEEIIRARENGSLPSLSRAGSENVGEVMKQHTTALWDQTYPYNIFCPYYHGRDTYTGCVATAVAIVMKYHSWPESGTGVIPGYYTEQLGIYVPPIELGYKYEWSEMLDDYSSGKYTQSQAEAVGRLMADCGAMLEADYNPVNMSSGTGAYSSAIAAALAKYMQYDASAIEYYSSAYSSSEWNRMLQTELDENGPVLYSGSSSEGGHMFVLDGYTSKNYYSVNWGWTGSCNGFYLLSALKPSEQGSGGFEGGYNRFQSAIFNVKQNQGGSPVSEIVLLHYTYDEGHEIKGLEAYTDEFEVGIPFDMQVGFASNFSNMNYTGVFGIALADSRGSVKEILHEEKVEDLQPYWGMSFSARVVITSSIEIGDQLIAVFYDYATSSWKKMRGVTDWGAVVDSIPVTDGVSIEKATSFIYDSAKRIITLITKKGVEVSLYDASDLICDNALMMSGQRISINTSALEKGRYRLVLTKRNEIKELYFVVGDNKE